MKKLLPIFIVIVLVVAAGAFFAGMKYGQNKNSAGRNFANMTSEQRQQMIQQGGGGNFRAGNGNRGSGASFASGDILSKDDKSITLKLRDGGSKVVFYSDSTEIGKFASGSFNDLTTGEAITVTGTTNSDGSITAQSIQIRPEMPIPQNINQ
jgi:hypothetical protein